MACSAFKLQDMCLKGIPLGVILLNIAAATTILSFWSTTKCLNNRHKIVKVVDILHPAHIVFHQSVKLISTGKFDPFRANIEIALMKADITSASRATRNTLMPQNGSHLFGVLLLVLITLRLECFVTCHKPVEEDTRFDTRHLW
ncbi:hypothetical protein RRG08_057511 [Elysia crispata]|uniref:Uncharacterized protein n=1 Tax=Elysia crispata TaxID=231223 RepID=A0AAE1D778_9GAST|nr:hypothetical protein RRG08_057511 [Elysia crispata]